jgi:hypothetical protein
MSVTGVGNGSLVRDDQPNDLSHMKESPSLEDTDGEVESIPAGGRATIADTFMYPFRPGWRRAWPLGVLFVAIWPLAFIPLLGYAVAAVRSAAADPDAGPPAWRWNARLISDGAWTALALALISAPFLLLWWPLSGFLDALMKRFHIGPVDPVLVRAIAVDVAGALVLLPWIGLLLVLMPLATARFALTGRPSELFDYRAGVADVRSRPGDWNLAVAAIVTAWILGLAATGVVCVGLLPGVFYAILVSSDATATLATPSREKTGRVAPDPAPG